MSCSESDDSPVRLPPKRGEGAPSKWSQSLEERTLAEDVQLFSGAQCRNGSSCYMMDSSGDTDVSPEHRLAQRSQLAPPATPLDTGSGTALPKSGLCVSTRSMSSPDSEDSPFALPPKMGELGARGMSSLPFAGEESERSGTDNRLPTPSSKKLASMGSPLDRIRIVAGGKAKRRGREGGFRVWLWPHFRLPKKWCR